MAPARLTDGTIGVPSVREPPRIFRRLLTVRGGSGASRFSAEVRERAVGLVLANEERHESQWATIQSIAEKDRLFDGGAAAMGAASRA